MNRLSFGHILLLLATAVAVIVVFQRARIPSSLGDLLVGVALGPHTAGPVIEEGQIQGAAVQRLALHGLATPCILEQEQEQDCDLIVIGKHGSGMLEELLLGSVTKPVLALSSADVLVCDRPLG